MLTHLFEFYDFVKDKTPLSKKKIKHSKRVAKLVKTLSDSDDVYYAALYHDFIEGGGDLKNLNKTSTYQSFRMILALTKNDGDDTLGSLKKNLFGQEQKFINDVIKIKLCDRYDNLKKRNKNDELSKKYLKKSIKLVRYLYESYVGSDKYIIENFLIIFHFN